MVWFRDEGLCGEAGVPARQDVRRDAERSVPRAGVDINGRRDALHWNHEAADAQGRQGRGQGTVESWNMN